MATRAGPLVGGFVDAQGRGNIGTAIKVVDVERLNLLDAAAASLASRSSVISSLALARTSPVSALTMLWAMTRPIMNSSGHR
jgi:hypothetical protein